VQDVRVFAGRDSNGVRGIKLKSGDMLVSMALINGDIAANADERYAFLKMAAKLRGVTEDELNESSSSDEEGDTPQQIITLSEERFKEMAAKEDIILAITANGYGKRTSSYEFRTTSRGSQGFVGMITNSRNGPIVASLPVNKNADLILVSNQGQIMRCPVDDIRTTGRRTQGVIVFRLPKAGETIASLCLSEDVED